MSDKNIGLSVDNVFSRMLRSQLFATIAVAVIAYIISGMHAGLSALAGGMSVVIAAFFASKIARRNQKEAAAVLVTLIKAEALKIIVIVAILFVTFKMYKQLVPIALIAGLATSALVSGAAMSKLDKTELKL